MTETSCVRARYTDNKCRLHFILRVSHEHIACVCGQRRRKYNEQRLRLRSIPHRRRSSLVLYVLAIIVYRWATYKVLTGVPYPSQEEGQESQTDVLEERNLCFANYPQEEDGSKIHQRRTN